MEKNTRNILFLSLCGYLVIFAVTAVWMVSRPHTTVPGPQNYGREVLVSKTGPANALDALVLRTIDGDTVVAVVELGYDVMLRIRIRLARIDTSELKGPESEKAEEAKKFLENALLKTRNRVKVLAIAKDSFGRFVCEMWIEDSGAFCNLSDELLKNGLAKVYVH